MQLHADWAVTLACGASCPYVPTTVEDWDVPDPAGRPLEEVRLIRDEIDRRVRDLVDNRLDAIRSDRTAHQVRLYRMLPQLIEEFDGVRGPEQIRSVRRRDPRRLRRCAHPELRHEPGHPPHPRLLRADHCPALETAA
jgi:hypothetical protein